jgi:hypothetical protein
LDRVLYPFQSAWDLLEHTFYLLLEYLPKSAQEQTDQRDDRHCDQSLVALLIVSKHLFTAALSATTAFSIAHLISYAQWV